MARTACAAAVVLAMLFSADAEAGVSSSVAALQVALRAERLYGSPSPLMKSLM